MVSPLTFLVQELGGRPGEWPPLVCISTVPEALNSILSPQPSALDSAVAALAHCPPALSHSPPAPDQRRQLHKVISAVNLLSTKMGLYTSYSLCMEKDPSSRVSSIRINSGKLGSANTCRHTPSLCFSGPVYYLQWSSAPRAQQQP